MEGKELNTRWKALNKQLISVASKILGFCGPRFTWCNMQEGESRIYLFLDRDFATIEWLNHFGNSRVHHLVESALNHCVLMITDTTPPSQPHKYFHFEVLWIKRYDCKEVIETA